MNHTLAYLNLCFQTSKIIVDKFHIAMLLNRASNIASVNIMNSFRRTNPPLYNKYKDFWKFFFTPEETWKILIIRIIDYLKNLKIIKEL